MAIALPEVLREEPRYRLLFAGPVLSVIGDRDAVEQPLYLPVGVARRHAGTLRADAYAP